MIRRTRLAIGLTIALLGVAACSGGGATTAPTLVPAPGDGSPAAPGGSSSPEAPGGSAAGGGATVVATEVGDAGTILVDGATGLTLYYFTKDVKDSGESVCTGDCLVTWPALTVDAGQAPTADDGVTGELGTITRADDGTTQVTYNGLPLYFFNADKAPGDLNGVYENWVTVAP